MISPSGKMITQHTLPSTVKIWKRIFMVKCGCLISKFNPGTLTYLFSYLLHVSRGHITPLGPSGTLSELRNCNQRTCHYSLLTRPLSSSSSCLSVFDFYSTDLFQWCILIWALWRHRRFSTFWRAIWGISSTLCSDSKMFCTIQVGKRRKTIGN